MAAVGGSKHLLQCCLRKEVQQNNVSALCGSSPRAPRALGMVPSALKLELKEITS